jgi:hypothetical protein
MAKRNGKTDAKQKNKQGFDSSKSDSEFSKDLDGGSGSVAANQAHKEKAKNMKSSKNQGEWNGMN